MENPLISIIVPVYNVSSYLEECIESILAQTYRKLEIILINDGSTDNSGEICEKYAKEDKRIIIIRQSNKGLSAARNTGLDVAKGDYISFVDSDDYIHERYIELLWKCAKEQKSDYVIGSYEKVTEKGKRAVAYREDIAVQRYGRRETMLAMLYRRKLSMYAHGKLYKRELYDQIRFPEGKLYEDIPTTWKIVQRISNTVYIDFPLYYYRQRPGSIVKEKYSSKKMDQVYAVRDILEETKQDKEIYQAAVCLYFFCLSDLYAQVEDRNTKEWKFLEDEIKKYRSYVIRDKKCDKTFRIMAGISYLPLCFMKMVGKKYKRIQQIMYKH